VPLKIHTAVYDVLGEKMSSIKNNKEEIEVVTLSKFHIQKNRNHLGFLNDKDGFNLEV